MKRVAAGTHLSTPGLFEPRSQIVERIRKKNGYGVGYCADAFSLQVPFAARTNDQCFTGGICKLALYCVKLAHQVLKIEGIL